jgi:hypothetical protein
MDDIYQNQLYSKDCTNNVDDNPNSNLNQSYHQKHQKKHQKKHPKQFQEKKKQTNQYTTIKIILTNNANNNNKKLLKFFQKNLKTFNDCNIIFDWIVAYPEEKDMYKDQNIDKFPVLIPTVNKQINPSSYRIGTDEIINYLRNIVNGIRNNEKSRVKNSGITDNGEFDANEFFIDQMTHEDDTDDMDENEKFRNTLTSRLASMQKSREIVGQHTSSMSNPEIHERNAQSASRSGNFNFNQNSNFTNQKSNFNNKSNSSRKKSRDNNLNNDNPTPSQILNNNGSKDLDNDLMANFWENLEETQL